MKEILPGLFTFTGLWVGRAYAIRDPDGLTLVDTSIPSAGPKILRQVRRKGYSDADVRRILITHAHPDHVGGLKHLLEKTGAEVITSEPEARVIRGEIPVARPARSGASPFDRASDRLAETMEPLKVDRIVRGGEVLEDVMEGLRVIDTPGHAPGHIAFWQAEMRILFLGDVVFNIVGLTLPFPFATPDMEENIRSAQKVAELAPAVVCFGHGPVLKNQAAERLSAFAYKVRMSPN